MEPQQTPDFSRISKVDLVGDGNIVLQDIQGSSITINYLDTEKLKSVIQHLNDTQTSELRALIGNQHKEILAEIRKIQDKLDQENTDQKADEVISSLDEFFKEIQTIKVNGARSRLLTNYKLLREYEELLILEDDPKRKMKYRLEMETIKGNISRDESELLSMAKK